MTPQKGEKCVVVPLRGQIAKKSKKWGGQPKKQLPARRGKSDELIPLGIIQIADVSQFVDQLVLIELQCAAQIR